MSLVPFVVLTHVSFVFVFQKCRYSKLEKAGILEMTVEFLTDVPKTPINGARYFFFFLPIYLL